MFNDHTTPEAVTKSLSDTVVFFLPENVLGTPIPTDRWLRYGSKSLGKAYGALLRLDCCLRSSGEVEADAPSLACPNVEEVERLLRQAEELGYLPKQDELLGSLQRDRELAESDTHNFLWEANEARKAAPPRPPTVSWEHDLLERVNDLLYGGTDETADSLCKMVVVEEEILSYFYLRRRLFGEPLPVGQVKAELEKLRQTLVGRFGAVPAAGLRFGAWAEAMTCGWYLDVDELSGPFWKSFV